MARSPRRSSRRRPGRVRSRPGAAGGRPVDTVAWVVVRAVEHVTISYVLEDPPLARADVVDELTGLVVGYLDGRRGPDGTTALNRQP